MKRIDELFRRLRAEKRCGLIAYVTCGDPDIDTTIRIVEELGRAGADAIELGVPFSDPIADGPVIQGAAQRALRQGTTMVDVLRVARAIREKSQIPLIAFSYLNPILRYGVQRFPEDAAALCVPASRGRDVRPPRPRDARSGLRSPTSRPCAG